jgi:hypothetical protein
MLWMWLGLGYFLGAAIGWGIMTERVEPIKDGPAPLIALLWPLGLLFIPLAIVCVVAYLPYRLGKFLATVPDLLAERRVRLAEIERRLRACEHCGEPHDPEDECEEDALMRKNG